MAPIPFAVHTTLCTSSNSKAKIRFDRPANVICHAVPLNGSTSADCQRFDNTEPKAQLKEPPSKLNDQPSSFQCRVVPDINSGQIRTVIPKIPSPSPALPRLEM